MLFPDIPADWNVVEFCDQESAAEATWRTMGGIYGERKFAAKITLTAPVDLEGTLWRQRCKGRSWCSSCDLGHGHPGFSVVVVAGQVGRDAKPMHPNWVRAIRDVCVFERVPFWFAGWGEYVEWDGSQSPSPSGRFQHPDNTPFFRVGADLSGRLLDGREWSEMPKR